MDKQAILESLDLVAERSPDPAPQVYARLFARHPEMEALFVRDVTGDVRGQMLAQAVEVLLDYLGPRAFAVNLLRTEVHNHDNMGVPGETFPAFYRAMAEAFEAIGGRDWTPAMTAAWQEVAEAFGEIIAAEARSV
ncbi:MAG: globin domain-containing protein [Pseudomonadota bacterium]